MQEPFINIKKKSGEISISHKKSNKSLLNTEFNNLIPLLINLLKKYLITNIIIFIL